MVVAAVAVVLFAIAFALHVICWRLRRPARPVGALLVILVGTLILGLMIAAQVVVLGPWQLAHIALFHIAATLAYIVLYSALEQDSPSLTIIAYVAAAQGRGRKPEELRGLVRDEQIVGVRFDALLAAGIVIQSPSELYLLTPRGRRWARLLNLFRRLYRLDKGG